MRYRGLVWPALLIFAGVVALLVNTGLLSVDRLYELVNLWPLILIVIGLELIVRRTAHGTTANVATALIVLLAIAGAAAYVTIVRSFSRSTVSTRCASWEIVAGSSTSRFMASASVFMAS